VKSLLTRLLEDKKKKHAWKAMALSQLEEANLTVNKLAKFDALGRIQTDAIEKFFEKGDTNYKRIFDTLLNFAADVEEALSDFSSALIPVKWVMEELNKELRNQREEIGRGGLWHSTQ
jgi:hypothetical protein